MSLILSGTDGLSDVDGSAATPAIRGTDANTGIFFPAADTVAVSTGGTERARFNSTGAFVLAGGTTTADGIGITFPASQSASSNANTLDDYEEGTWTPSIELFSGSPSYPGVRQGKYTKIGNVVHVWCDVAFTASVGAAIQNLAGLPFNVNGYSSYYPGPAISNFYFINLGTGGTQLGGYWSNGQNFLRFHSCGNNTDQLTPFTTSGTMEIRMEGIYTVS